MPSTTDIALTVLVLALLLTWPVSWAVDCARKVTER